MDDKAMPQFMFKSPRGTGYIFRRAVPADVRPMIGKREFKVTLGGDYRSASQRCRELAVETDQQISAARAGFTALSTPPSPTQQETAPSSVPLVSLQEVTPDLIAQLHATVINEVLTGDRKLRYRAREAINPVEKLREIQRVRSWAVLAWHGDEIAVYGWLDMLIGTLRRNGYCLAPELHRSQQERELLIEYASAYRDALDLLEAEYSGRSTAVRLPASPLLQPVEPAAAPASGAMLLSTAISEFIKHLHPGKRAMNEKHGFILPAFLEIVGDMPVTDLRQSHVRDFLLTIQRLPPRWPDVRRKEGAAIRELAGRDWDVTLSLKTYESSYRASLRTFLDRAVADWQDVGFPTTLTTNIPYLGTRTKTERKQRALRSHEIQLIFFSEKMQKIIKSPSQVHKFWLLALEIYTGARVREVCQINPQSDFGVNGGQWWLRLTDEPGEQPDPEVVKSIKTGKPRTIPVHAELVRLGLPGYLEHLKRSGARRLFPKWSPTDGDAGSAPSKWVSNYMKSIGLHGVANELGHAVRGSHTFRHTLLTWGRLKGVNLRCISGHAEATDNPVADGYEDETFLVTLSDMAERLARLDFGVALPAPVRAQVV